MSSGILGQAAPAATTLTDIYTCPTNIVAVMRVIITNRGINDASFRVAVSPDGDAIEDKHFIAFDKLMAGNDTGSTIAFVVNEDDIVRVFAENAEFSFTATGEERAE
ncbi:MAG: hypothetical protein QGD91_10230 [Actinomycetota bacterium]|nr:hypothetical protein [Actinomycetota bacterium]